MSGAAVLLCAGQGSRYLAADGHHKLKANYRGRPLVSWAIDHALAAGLPATCVVLGAADLRDLLPDDVAVLDNPDWPDGIATSLACAIDWAVGRGHDSITVGLGDQPHVSPKAWSTVAAAPAAIAVACYQGKRRNPVRLAASTWDALPRSGDEGARKLMASRPELVAEIACAGSAFDIDTVEDLRRLSEKGEGFM